MTVVQIRGRRAGQRSKVTTGSNMFIEGDGRSPWARRWSDLIIAHVNDLGGPEMLSEAQISICRRVATLECELESIEGKMSASQPFDIEVYVRLARTLCRLFELIGIKGRAKLLDPQGQLFERRSGGDMSDKQSSERRAFYRARIKLQAEKIIGIWGAYVWAA
jgi:hypothetical protein